MATRTKKRKKASAKKPGKQAPARQKAKKTKAARKKVRKVSAAPKRAKKTTRKPPKRKPLVRRDATGHLDRDYERDLLRRSRENQEHDDDRAFLVGKRRNDSLAQELGREFVETVTSGEDDGVALRDKVVPEEIGGPFVRSTAGQEFGEEPDESNPAAAKRDPFPRS